MTELNGTRVWVMFLALPLEQMRQQPDGCLGVHEISAVFVAGNTLRILADTVYKHAGIDHPQQSSTSQP